MIRIHPEAADILAAEGNAPVLEEIAQRKHPGRTAGEWGVVEVKLSPTYIRRAGRVMRVHDGRAQELTHAAGNNHVMRNTVVINDLDLEECVAVLRVIGLSSV